MRTPPTSLPLLRSAALFNDNKNNKILVQSPFLRRTNKSLGEGQCLACFYHYSTLLCAPCNSWPWQPGPNHPLSRRFWRPRGPGGLERQLWVCSSRFRHSTPKWRKHSKGAHQRARRKYHTRNQTINKTSNIQQAMMGVHTLRAGAAATAHGGGGEISVVCTHA